MASDSFINDVEYVGPFEVTEVVLRGRKVPYLTAHKGSDGTVRSLTLDHRMGFDLPEPTPEDPYVAIRLIDFLADAIAIGMGYACFPQSPDDEPTRLKPFPRMTAIDSIQTDDGAR